MAVAFVWSGAINPNVLWKFKPKTAKSFGINVAVWWRQAVSTWHPAFTWLGSAEILEHLPNGG